MSFFNSLIIHTVVLSDDRIVDLSRCSVYQECNLFGLVAMSSTFRSGSYEARVSWWRTRGQGSCFRSCNVHVSRPFRCYFTPGSTVIKRWQECAMVFAGSRRCFFLQLPSLPWRNDLLLLHIYDPRSLLSHYVISRMLAYVLGALPTPSAVLYEPMPYLPTVTDSRLWCSWCFQQHFGAVTQSSDNDEMAVMEDRWIWRL